MNVENLENMYNNLAITNVEGFWKVVILEHLINNFEGRDIESLNITKEKIDNMIRDIMINDDLWGEIDYAVENAIDKETKKGEKK